MKKTISYTAFNRPHYLEESLQHLIHNDLTNWHVFFQIDYSERIGDNLDVIKKVCANVEWSYQTNDVKLGCEKNTYKSLEYVFNDLHSDMNIYLEDDVIVSPDITQMADWYMHIDKNDIICLNLLYGSCGGRFHKYYKHLSKDIIHRVKQFNSLGLIFTKEQWEEYFKPYWLGNTYNTDAWDCEIQGQWIENKNSKMYTLQPDFARSNHIGRTGGAKCPTQFHDRTFRRIELCKEINNDYKIIYSHY